MKMRIFKDAIEMDKRALKLGWDEADNVLSARSVEPMTRLRNIQVENRGSTHSKQLKETEKEEGSRKILQGNLKINDDDDGNESDLFIKN